MTGQYCWTYFMIVHELFVNEQVNFIWGQKRKLLCCPQVEVLKSWVVQVHFSPFSSKKYPIWRKLGTFSDCKGLSFFNHYYFWYIIYFWTRMGYWGQYNILFSWPNSRWFNKPVQFHQFLAYYHTNFITRNRPCLLKNNETVLKCSQK